MRLPIFFDKLYWSRIPTKWSQVTLQQFIQLQDLQETENSITNLVQQMSILTGQSEKTIRNWKSNKLDFVANKLKFMEHQPKERNVKKFYHNYKLFKSSKLDQTTVGQVTDLLQMNTDQENVGRKILNALAVNFYTGKDEEYNSDRYAKMKKELLSLDLETALGASAFFLRGLRGYLPSVLQRFLSQATIAQLEKLTSEIERPYDWSAYVKFINGTTS